MEFISLAEETGHIVALGDWVFEAVCQQLHEFMQDGLTPVPIAVNLSTIQLRDLDLPERLIVKIKEYGIDPGLIEVEVTESMLVEDIDLASSILAKLRQSGIDVSLDDFGNGFSSLSYIKTLPIDTIKIDRLFIKDIMNSPDDAIIVESTITLAHNLGLKVIAEGVETRDQLMHLKTAGCDAVQGYFFSRPVPSNQVPDMLLNTTKWPL